MLYRKAETDGTIGTYFLVSVFEFLEYPQFMQDHSCVILTMLASSPLVFSLGSGRAISFLSCHGFYSSVFHTDATLAFFDSGICEESRLLETDARWECPLYDAPDRVTEE